MRCPIFVATLVVLAFTGAVFLFNATLGDDSETPRSAWLKTHSPQQAHHDAEMLRRRMLTELSALGPADLAAHVPQLVACLSHHDDQVRTSALEMLSKMEPSAIAEHTDRLASSLRQSHGDDAVRSFALKTLLTLGDIPTVASNSEPIFECLSAESAEVRKAAVDVLALLEPEDLAPYTQAVAQSVAQRHDTALASAIVVAWGMKLESEACRARAGESACQGVLRGLNALTSGKTALEV